MEEVLSFPSQKKDGDGACGGRAIFAHAKGGGYFGEKEKATACDEEREPLVERRWNHADRGVDIGRALEGRAAGKRENMGT